MLFFSKTRTDVRQARQLLEGVDLVRSDGGRLVRQVQLEVGDRLDAVRRDGLDQTIDLKAG